MQVIGKKPPDELVEAASFFAWIDQARRGS